MEPLDDLEGDHTVSHGRVFRKTIDYSTHWVGVEEKHRSMSHSLQHCIMEAIAEMHEYSSD